MEQDSTKGTVHETAAITAKRSDLIESIMDFHFGQSRGKPKRLARAQEALYSHLVGTTADNQGIFLVWGDLTEDAYEAIVQEADQAGLDGRYHVHSRRGLIVCDDVIWHELPGHHFTPAP